MGYTKEEARKHIQEVVEMVVEELIEDGEFIPESPQEEVVVFSDSRVAVDVPYWTLDKFQSPIP